MNPVRRRLLLSLGLAFAIGSAIWTTFFLESGVDVASPAVEKNGVAEKVAKQAHRPASSAEPLDFRTTIAGGEVNPFSAKSWYVPPPPPPPVPPAAPPIPTPPPLPFTYIGKMEEDGRLLVYLAKGEQIFTVEKGATFDDVYRFDGVENGSLVVVYLPLSARQLISAGTAS